MTKSDTNPLFGKYVPNYIVNGRAGIDLNTLITSGKCSIINIFPEDFADRDEDTAPNSEYNRRAGIGKSVLLKLSVEEFHQWRKQSGDKSYRVQDMEDIPVIDFSSTNFNTRSGILINIIKALLTLDSDLEKYFKQHKAGAWNNISTRFPEITGGKRYNNSDEDDPSHVAALLFEELTQDLFKQYFEEKESGKLFLFFDSFDEQYVGSSEVALFRWLVNILFPWLAGVMKISLVIAGRERLEMSKDDKFKTEVARLIKRVELHRFEENQVKEYFDRYFYSKNPDESKEPHPQLPDKKDAVWKKITDLTDGKPIFIDFFCDLAKKDKDFKAGNQNLTQLLDRMVAGAGAEAPLKAQQKTFKTYLINRLHLRDPRKDKLDEKDRDIYFRAEVIRILSVARHGLTPEQYQQVRDEGFANEKKTEEVRHYFENTFTATFGKKGKRSEGLPYVKNRGHVRLLHDEIMELLQQYHWNEVDPERKEYNKRLSQITQLYEEKLLLADDETRYSRLLEYIEYRFSFHGRKEETDAINRYLYEFSLYLDSFPDLCSRINAKARYYYTLKRSDFDKRREKDPPEPPPANTLNFDNDFPLLAKIPMRTVEYLLTERTSSDWSEILKQHLGELRKYMDLLSLSSEQKEALEARILSSEGEMLLWKNDWKKGEAKIQEAKKLFYLTGDSHAQDWCVHLLGFELQRRADFTRALKRHQTTIDSAIVSLSNLCDEPETKRGHEDYYSNHYRLRRLVKVLSRAGSNTAVNHRYRGRVVDGIKALQSFRIMAKITGGREELRLSINQKQLDALQWKILNFDFEDKQASHFQDALLLRRLTFAKLIYELRQVGREDRYYRMTNQEFDMKESMSRMNETLLPVMTALKGLQREFAPVAPPLYPKLKKVEITQPYEEVSNVILANRENAELYYQFGGRVVLSAKYSPDGQQSYFDVARIAYENALTVAQESGFEFLVMQALESSCRLHYLTGNTIELEKNIQAFDKKRKELEEKGYTPYYDLLSKYWLTRADQALQILDGQHLDSNGKPTAINAYVEMLLYAVQHNQFLYHLVLEIFASRLKVIFSRMYDSDIMFFKRAILSAVQTSELIQKDKRFMNYIGWLLQAVTLHSNLEHVEEEVLIDIKKGIRRLMQRGEFIKAATINELLIEHYEKHYKREDQTAQLAYRLYQQVYIYQGAHKHSRVKELLHRMNALIEMNKSILKPNHPVFITHDIARAIHLYRTADIWNLEQFLLGELECLRANTQNNKTTPAFFEEPQNLLENTIEKMSEYLKNLRKPDQKLLAEALLRLGELYVLSGEKERTFLQRFEPKLTPVKKLLRQEDVKKAGERSLVDGKLSPAIYTFNIAYLYARLIGDTHRDADALQSIANALYFAGTSRGKDGKERIVKKIKSKVIQKCKDERQEGSCRYPVVAARMHLVEGDVCFSELFDVSCQDDGSIKAKVREEVADPRKTKAMLHRMMWSYLSALSLLSDPNKVYQNFHFDNMLLEINRRILLIPDRTMIKMLREGLSAAWDIFRELQTRTESLKSIETELALHEVSLKVKEILLSSS